MKPVFGTFLLVLLFLFVFGQTKAAQDYNTAQVFVVGMSSDLDHAAGSVTNVIRKIMRNTPGITVMDLNKRLTATAPEHVKKSKKKAREELTRSKAALKEMDYSTALKHAMAARKAFERMGGYLDPLERYKESILLIAVSHGMMGNMKSSQKAFMDLLLLDPHLSMPKGKFESFIVDLFNKVKKSLPSQPVGSLSIKSVPSGANLYLDGKLKDVTPLSLDGLIAGSHLVVVKQPGYQNWGKVVRVAAGSQDILEVPLVAGQAGSSFVRVMTRACRAVTESESLDDVLALGQVLGLDWAILGQLSRDAYDHKLRLYLFEFSHAKTVYEDELMVDPSYGLEDDVKSFAMEFIRKGKRALARFRQRGDPLSGRTGTEDWNRDSGGDVKEHSVIKAKNHDSSRDEKSEDPLDEVDGTEDW